MAGLGEKCTGGQKPMRLIKNIVIIIPLIWILGLLPFANRVKPFVLGLPFLLFWMLTGILVAFFCMWIRYNIDRREQ
jgi:hypothetical protein